MGTGPRTIVVMHTGGDGYATMSRALVDGFRAHGVRADSFQVPAAVFLESRIAAKIEGDAEQLRKMFHTGLRQSGVTDTFIVNRARFDLPIPDGVAHHCWVQDPYVAPIEKGSVGEHTWMWVGRWAQWWGGEVLLPATDFGQHLQEASAWDADVAFAGYLPPALVEPGDPGFAMFSGEVRIAVAESLNMASRAVIAELEDSRSFICDRGYAEVIVERAGKRLGQSLKGPLYDTVLLRTRSHLVRHVQRRRLMEFLIPLCERRRWCLRIAGMGWEKLRIAKPYAVGPIPAGPQLARFYQSAKVNLQLNGDTNVHSRLLEGLACGAFMLSEANPTDDQPYGLRSILAADCAPTYRSFDELEALLEKYIENGATAREAAARGGAIVREQHNYKVRAAQILAG